MSLRNEHCSVAARPRKFHGPLRPQRHQAPRPGLLLVMHILQTHNRHLVQDALGFFSTCVEVRRQRDMSAWLLENSPEKADDSGWLFASQELQNQPLVSNFSKSAHGSFSQWWDSSRVNTEKLCLILGRHPVSPMLRSLRAKCLSFVLNSRQKPFGHTKTTNDVTGLPLSPKIYLLTRTTMKRIEMIQLMSHWGAQRRPQTRQHCSGERTCWPKTTLVDLAAFMIYQQTFRRKLVFCDCMPLLRGQRSCKGSHYTMSSR